MAIELTNQLYPDIVIMDIRLQGMSGIEATKWIRKTCPKVKIIGLSFHSLPENVQEIMQNGAVGYLTKFSSPVEIFKAITEVHRGNSYICEDMADKLNWS